MDPVQPTDDTEFTQPATAPRKSLNEFIINCKRLSATLPPDDCWTDENPLPRIERARSGTLSLSLADTPNRQAINVPTSASPGFGLGSHMSTQSQYFISNFVSYPNLSNAEDSGASLLRILGARNMPSPESLIPGPSTSQESLPIPLNQDGPYPIILPKTRGGSNDNIHPALRAADPALRAASTAPLVPVLSKSHSRSDPNKSPYSLPPRRGTFTPTNRIHVPSPLRNVSLPGDSMEDIEMLPQNLPCQPHELPGPAEEKKSWFLKWFSCGGCRKCRP